MKICYNCKQRLRFFKTWWYACYHCGFPIEITNIMNNMDYDEKKKLVKALSKDLCFTFTQESQS